jgi:hypothetical protein
LFKPGAAGKNREHGADFSGRAPANVKKSEKFIGGSSFEALCNIIGNRKDGAFKLIPKGTREARGRRGKKIIGSVVELCGGLPHWQIFKTFVGRHGHDRFPLPIIAGFPH